ncbi:hypothetical protein SUGI_0001520 [Cryptomeria japonica]|nr:hypothetical protein SUGI_0001520 [Cryptomeria japonica]
MINGEEGCGAFAVPSPRVRSSAASVSCDSKAAGTVFSEMSESECDLNSPEQWRRRKVKFLCSFGGNILPRPYDGKLRYVGGETRIVRVSRDISFSELVVKMSEFYDQPFTIKYQLPEEEDLDALVSVLSDDDLANMMEEYDKLEAADGFTRLRVFLFSASEQFDVASVCVEADVDQRFVDALNGLPESVSSSDIWNQHTEFLRRNESFSSFNCVGHENGLNPRRIMQNSQQDTILVASPPLSPLRQPLSPFEESSDHYRQEHQQLWTLGRQPSSPFEESSDYYRQEHQQSWTLGNYPRTQDSAPSMATAGCPFQEAAMPSEALLGYHKYKHSMKVFPSNELYYTGSPEFESPRDINRMEVANHWPEDNHKHPIPVADIVPHQVNVHQHHFHQQPPPQHQQQNVHPVHQPTVGYCPPEFFQNSEVSSPQRKIVMQPVKYCRLFEHLEQNEAQYLAPEVYEGEISWHGPHQPLSHPVTPDFANTKVPQVKLGSQNVAVGCRIGEGLGRNVLHHVPSASELDRHSESQKHAQAVWQHEGRLDYGSAQSSPHFEPASSIANHTIHLPCGRNVNQQHCQLSGTGENVGLIGQNISQIHGRFERSSTFENPYERRFACDMRSSIMHAEHPSYYQDQCGSSKLECQVHNPQSVTKEGLLMRNASTQVDQLPPSIDKVQTDIGYRDRVEKARAWVLDSTNYQRDTIHTIHRPYAVEPSGVLTTEEGIFRDASQNSYAEHDSRWLNPEVVYHDPSSADLYKHATCDQYELSTHVPCNLQHKMINNQLDSDLVVHLGSTGGQSQWCYSSGDERSQEFACAQRNAENMEMVQQSYGSSDKSAVDVHNFAGVHIIDDLLHKEIANISQYEEDPPKEFNQYSGPEITKEIQGDHPVTVSSHYQMQRQLGGLIEEVSVAFVNSKSSVTIANTACSHIITSSKVLLSNSLTLQLPNEILSSALPSSGPPIYDQSPVNSTNIAGPKDLLSETEREGQFNELENPELKTIGRGHLSEEIVSNMEVARNENLEKDAPEISLKDRPEKVASGKSENLKSAEQSPILAASTTTSTAKVVGTEPLVASTREEDSEEADQKAFPTASSIKDDPPEEKLPKENALRLENFSNGSVNKANDNVSGPEADDLAQGLQTIRNDDLEEIRELGSGTYGTVYYGKWKGSDVAIKRIKASCFADRASELIADFWKEARILGQLHHPNVVAFYGIVRDGPDGTLATVTEYMVNGSLKQVLHKKDRTIDRRKRLIIARDAAFGMEYLHEKKIVHFDLKCDNLLVNMKDPHRPICKIGDLGLSKIKHQTLVSGGVRGTLPWMAPELLSEEKGMVTEKVDVYSFGIVMWELLTGEEPYANMHFGEIIGGIMNNTLRPTIPDWCREPAWRLLQSYGQWANQ